VGRRAQREEVMERRSRARGGRVRPRERGMEERSLQRAEGRG
jgi:hypothetical protein